MIKNKKEILELQKIWYEKAISYFNGRQALADTIGIKHYHLVWISKGNLMKPEHALKFDYHFDWFKADEIRPDVFSKIMMDVQRKEWEKNGWGDTIQLTL